MDELEVRRGATVRDLGLSAGPEGDRLVGRATIVPEMWTPGTEGLRLSVLATWADIVTGVLAGATYRPRVGVTLDLDVHLLGPPPRSGTVTGVAAVLKAGRSVIVNRAWFTLDGEPEPFAVATGSFMASPNPDHVFRDDGVPGRILEQGTLSEPLAARAGIVHHAPGLVELPAWIENRNASDAIQGGLLSLVAEEAALSLAPGAHLSSVALRYLRGFRSGPALATATRHGRLALVEITDPATGRLGASATATLGGSEP